MNPTIIAKKIDTITKAWEALAPGATFGGLDLAAFKAAIQPSLDERAVLEGLNRSRAGAIARRIVADDASAKVLRLVVNGVRGEPAYGERSDLYRAMGYKVPEEKGSGLTRRGDQTGAQEVVA